MTPTAKERSPEVESGPEIQAVVETGEIAFRAEGLGYSFSIPRLATTFHVGHLKRSGGALHGEVLVRSTLAGVRTYVNDAVMAPSQINLSSAQTRKQFAKLIAERIPGAGLADWVGFIENASTRILLAEEAEDRFENVGTNEEGGEDPLFVQPLLPRGKATILFADGGSGKSLTAIAVALSVTTGLTIIPDIVPTTQAPILYLDWETDRNDMNRRVKQVCAGAHILPTKIHYAFCNRRLSDILDNVARFVAREGIGLLVVDSLGLASGAAGDYGDPADAALRTFAAIRAINTTTLAVDHVPKFGPGLQQSSKPYGSTYKVNLARATWELRQATAPDRSLHMALYHRKANTTALHAALGYRVRFEAGAVWWEAEDISEADLTSGLPLADRLAVALRERGEMSTKEMAAATEASEATVRSTLGRNGARFRALERGRWQIIEGGKLGPEYRTRQPEEPDDDDD